MCTGLCAHTVKRNPRPPSCTRSAARDALGLDALWALALLCGVIDSHSATSPVPWLHSLSLQRCSNCFLFAAASLAWFLWPGVILPAGVLRVLGSGDGARVGALEAATELAYERHSLGAVCAAGDKASSCS